MQDQNVANVPYDASEARNEQRASRNGGQKYKNIREAMEMAMHAIFLLCGVVAVAFVLLISIYLIISGIPAIREIGLVDFLFGQTWAPTHSTNPSYGILPFILTSIYGTAGAVLIGVPVGLLTAVYLSKCAPPKVAAVVHTAVELLAGIPSVVYGLVGMIVLVPAIRDLFNLPSGATLLAAIVVLAIMILPSIINVSESALNAVPKEYEEASLALGATKIETIFKVSLPAARSGVATAIVLGVGRAIGEAMAIIMVSGNVANMPGLLTSVRFLTTAIASEMSYAAVGSLQRNALFSIGLVLFLFIMLINVILNVFIKNKKEGDESMKELDFRRKVYDRTLKVLMYLCAGITCALLIFLIGYIFYRGVGSVSWELLTTQSSYRNDTIGILPNILNTVYIILVSMVIVLPLGVGAAIYLTEYAKNRKLVAIIELATEILTGIPSIIFGLVGMLFFIQMMGLKQGILAGGLTLVVMILPTIVRTTQESLKTVPQSYREGALGLGAGKWHMIRTVVLPNAVDGIVTGCILAIGRIVGESAALLFTAGFGLVLNGFVESLQSSSATLTVALYVYASERGETAVAFAIATILMVLTFIINFAANLAAKKLKKV